MTKTITTGKMPLTVRLNHAVADGSLIANVFRLIQKELEALTAEMHTKDTN